MKRTLLASVLFVLIGYVLASTMSRNDADLLAQDCTAMVKAGHWPVESCNN